MLETIKFCAELGWEMIIISGANTFFVQSTLKVQYFHAFLVRCLCILIHLPHGIQLAHDDIQRYGIEGYFSGVYTHEAKWEENGRLRVSAYHVRDNGTTVEVQQQQTTVVSRSQAIHSCDQCPDDLCKGMNSFLSTTYLCIVLLTINM